MAGHIDVRVEVAAPLDILLEVTNAAETAQAAARNDDPHSHGHETVQRDPARGSVIYSINPGSDPSDRTWAYQVERIVNEADKTAYARRWGNSNFLYSYAFWQYSGSDSHSEIRCVADFELVAGAPMDDQQMEAFMSRGTLAAMQSSARAVEAEYASRVTAQRPGTD